MRRETHCIFFRPYLWFVFLLGTSSSVLGNNDIAASLQKAGFENIRVLKEDSVIYISYENTIYRWTVRGIVVALDSIAMYAEPSDTLHIVVLSKGIPQVAIDTRVIDWLDFRNGKLLMKEYEKQLAISYNTALAWKKLNKLPFLNDSSWKLDLVLYTQFKLKNVYYDRFFDTQVNFAPAFELSLWKGAKGILQYIFPIVNSARVYGKEGNSIRPGFVTLSQDFQIHPQFYTTFVIGLFNQNRSGIDWRAVYQVSPWVSLKAEAACTGLTYLGGNLPNNWNFSTWNQLSWSIGGSYFNRYFSLQTSGFVQRFLTGDVGVRLGMERLFGEVAVGLYVLMTDGKKDAGFNVTIPLPGQKRPRFKNRFRVMLPEYFDWEYAVSNNVKSGVSFETRPDENKVEYLFNPVYLKSQILNK